MVMKHFTTIKDLVGNTKRKINDLHSIIDVLLAQFKSAAEMIDQDIDYRKHYVDQLKELNEAVSLIVDTHPALHSEKISLDTFERLMDAAHKNCNTNNIQI